MNIKVRCRYSQISAIACLVALLLATGCSWDCCAEKSPEPLFEADLKNAVNTNNAWSVENGILTASEDQCLWSKDMYSHFTLDLEFKNEEGTNSGVILYCTDRENWIPGSVEVQIADDYAEKWANQPATWQCAAFFGHKAANRQKVVNAPGEWNQMRITAEGPYIQVELNGQLVNEIDLTQYTSATEAPDGTPIPTWLSTPWADLAHEGYIGFQGKHADASIYYRNIMITEM